MEHLAVPESGSHPGFFSSTHAFNEIRMGVEPADFAARLLRGFKRRIKPLLARMVQAKQAACYLTGDERVAH